MVVKLTSRDTKCTVRDYDVDASMFHINYIKICLIDSSRTEVALKIKDILRIVSSS